MLYVTTEENKRYFDKQLILSRKFRKIAFSEVALGGNSGMDSRRSSPYFLPGIPYSDGSMRLSQLAQLRGMHPDLIRRMIDNVSFISDYFRALKKADKVSIYRSVVNISNNFTVEHHLYYNYQNDSILQVHVTKIN